MDILMSKITDMVSSFAEPVVQKHGCELWDVEYVKESGGWVLRVYIDREGGVSIDHCEAVSRELDTILDEHEDMIPGSYTFEVSSAGAERPLKRPSDFERFIGSLVEVKLYKARDGRKEFIGTLKEYLGGDIVVSVAERDYEFKKGEFSNVRLRIV